MTQSRSWVNFYYYYYNFYHYRRNCLQIKIIENRVLKIYAKMSRPGFPDFKNALSGLKFIRQNAGKCSSDYPSE